MLFYITLLHVPKKKPKHYKNEWNRKKNPYINRKRVKMYLEKM